MSGDIQRLALDCNKQHTPTFNANLLIIFYCIILLTFTNNFQWFLSVVREGLAQGPYTVTISEECAVDSRRLYLWYGFRRAAL